MAGRKRKAPARVRETLVRPRGAEAPGIREERVRKNMDMDPEKLKAVKALLGASSETEAVDRALSLVLGRERVRSAMDELTALGGLRDPYARAP